MNLASSSLLVLTPGDDVAVARGDIAKGQELFADGLGVTALADIASGHKIALRGVAQGQPVRKYGQIIGQASAALRPGDYVHVHNLQMPAASAAQALANVYKTRIDAVVSKAELEKLKLEKFGMQVNVYRAQIDANNAEWGGYKAALDGNGSLVNLYTGQVQAFGVEMSGFRTEVDAKAKVIETRAAANKALLEQHDSALRTYETVVKTRGEVARMQIEVDKTKLSAWSAEVQARLGYATANADVYRTRANVAIHNANSRMQAQDLQQKSMLSFQTAVVNLANTNADVYGRMANAALSGMNSVVSKSE